MKSLLVLNVVGLTPGLLPHTPRLAALGRDGFQASLGTVLPAVTCSAQATMLTGRPLMLPPCVLVRAECPLPDIA